MCCGDALRGRGLRTWVMSSTSVSSASSLSRSLPSAQISSEGSVSSKGLCQVCPRNHVARLVPPLLLPALPTLLGPADPLPPPRYRLSRGFRPGGHCPGRSVLREPEPLGAADHSLPLEGEALVEPGDPLGPTRLAASAPSLSLSLVGSREETQRTESISELQRVKVFHLFRQRERTFGSHSATKITDLRRVLAGRALAGHLAWVGSAESVPSPVMWAAGSPLGRDGPLRRLHSAGEV